MLVFSKNKYISDCLKKYGEISIINWVDQFDGKPVEKIRGNNYKEIGGSLLAKPEWVAEVDDKYFGG